jgi:hypothetical protein
MEDARHRVNQWVFHYRLVRQDYWRQRKLQSQGSQKKSAMRDGTLSPSPYLGATALSRRKAFGEIRDDDELNDGEGSGPFSVPSGEIDLTRDNDRVMHCLDCLFAGTGPCWISGNEASGETIVQHCLLANHNFGTWYGFALDKCCCSLARQALSVGSSIVAFVRSNQAVTCGEQDRIYCFQCGDFVTHEIFEQEQERIDISETFPWMGWKDYPVQRSFDALRFMRIPDQGIVWSGMYATYPPLIPNEHLMASRLSMRRQRFMQGWDVRFDKDTNPDVLEVAFRQNPKGACVG